MSTIKRIALASAVGMSLLSSTSFAAVPAVMQGAANEEARVITVAVNVKKQTLQCREATLRIASAAKAKGGKLKGAVLRSAIMGATSVAAKKYNIEDRCVTPIYVSNAASKLTGIYPTKGTTLGLAKIGGAGASAASGGIGALGIAAGVLGLAAVATVVANNDDNNTGDNAAVTVQTGSSN